MFITGSVSGDLVTLLVTLSVVVIGYYKWIYQYWARKNVPYLEPKIPYGNFVFGMRGHPGVRLKEFYNIMKKKGWKHGGLYNIWVPLYVVIDLEYVKNIMSKDFQYFSDRGIYHNEKADPISAHLFNIAGVKWRNLRTKLTPTFTSGKMKSMFHILVECESNLQKKIQNEYNKKEPIDIKEVLGCFTTDIIGSCAFGLECNTFQEENSLFRVFGRRAFERSRFEQIRRLFVRVFPRLSKNVFNIGLVPKDVSDFFRKLAADTVNYREENNVVRKDFIQLLIDLKNNKLGDEEGYKHDGTTLTMDEIAAQSFVFFIAGFETSSTTMTFALYELARYQDVQEKTRKEIIDVLAKHDGKITYDAIQEMKYLGQVIDEALRLHPPVAFHSRICVKDYQIPDTDIVIEKGTTVLIPVLGIHHDEEYYPNPEQFDPERFTEKNKSARHSYTHIPFGEGPRICIGMRFAIMQSKVGLASLLRNYSFTVNKKTQEPLQMKSNLTVSATVGEIWLDAHKL